MMRNPRQFTQHLFIVLIVAAYSLHLTRNLNITLGAAPILLSFVGILFCLINPKSQVLNRNCFYVLLGFSFLTFLVSIYSFIWYPEESYLYAYARYFYMFPFLIFLLLSDFKFDQLLTVFKVYLFFIVLGGLSLFYQSFYGPVYWFPEASEREGLVRFSSLVGSLTSYGIAAGIALPMVLISVKSNLYKISLLMVLIVSLLYTLQKAAVINILLFAVYFVFFYKFKNKYLICSATFLFVLLSISIAYYFDFDYVVKTIDNVFRIREGSGESDVHILDSIVDRLWSLPSVLYQKYGAYGVIFGVGLVAGSGALGFVEYPMSHNGFFDLLFIGGVINLMSFILLISIVVYRLSLFYKSCCLLGNDKANQSSCILFVFFQLMINMLFSGVVYFQPYTGIIFFSIVVFSLHTLPGIPRMRLRERQFRVLN